jgi:hypothetical protein
VSNNHFVYEGLEELKAELRALAKALAGEATGIAMNSASRAKAVVGAVYDKHRHKGNLARGLSMNVRAIGPFGTAVEVKNSASHAGWFDKGTQARHFNGANRGAMWGKTPTPPTHAFVKTMIVERRKMYEKLAAMLRRQGLQVSGDA